MHLFTRLALSLTLLFSRAAQATDRGLLLEFTAIGTQDWFNSAPLRVVDLRGKVVLLDNWTFGCWNCYRSFPWLDGLEASLARQAFQVVGIHSPEFANERARQ